MVNIMRNNTKQIGDISEAKVISRFIELGITVSIPFGDNQRYDLIADMEGKLLKIQIKTGRLKRGVIHFYTYNFSGSGKRAKKMDYKNSCNLFAVYCPENDNIYVIPVKTCSANGAFLRINKPKNNQKKGINWAEKYELTSEFRGIITGNESDC